MLGIVDTLVVKAKVNSAVALSRRVDKWRPRKGAKCDCTKRRLAAQQIAQNVEADIMDLLGPHEVSFAQQDSKDI